MYRLHHRPPHRACNIRLTRYRVRGPDGTRPRRPVRARAQTKRNRPRDSDLPHRSRPSGPALLKRLQLTGLRTQTGNCPQASLRAAKLFLLRQTCDAVEDLLRQLQQIHHLRHSRAADSVPSRDLSPVLHRSAVKEPLELVCPLQGWNPPCPRRLLTVRVTGAESTSTYHPELIDEGLAVARAGEPRQVNCGNRARMVNGSLFVGAHAQAAQPGISNDVSCSSRTVSGNVDGGRPRMLGTLRESGTAEATGQATDRWRIYRDKWSLLVSDSCGFSLCRSDAGSPNG